MKDAVARVLKNALNKKKVDLSEEEIEKLIEIPPNTEFGDYSFPCFFLAEKLHENPSQIAIELRGKIENASKIFEDIQTRGPYINFFVNRKNLAMRLVADVLSQKENFGKTNLGKAKKVVIEHTSINPNASPHVGRARNAIIGDSIVKLATFFNFKPE